MKITDTLKNIATFGLYSRAVEAERESLQIYSNKLEVEAKAHTLEKSLMDMSIGGDAYDTGYGNIGIYRTVDKDNRSLFTKQKAVTLRQFSQQSVWLRAAIDIFRNTLENAEPQLVPYDDKRPMKKTVVDSIESLLFEKTNFLGETYAVVKGKMIEDYLVLGHGVIRKELDRGLRPTEFLALNAGNVAFYPDWQGDIKVPRYALMNSPYGQVIKKFFDPEIMCAINRPTSYDVLGISHVEALYNTVSALLYGDDFLKTNVANPTPDVMINVPGANQQQLDETRRQIDETKRRMILVGSNTNPEVKKLGFSEAEMKVIDSQKWFVQEVASIFGLSLDKLRLHVEGGNKSSAETLIEDSEEGIGALLVKIQAIENLNIVKPFGSYKDTNIQIHYPILSKISEKKNAEVSKLRLGGLGYTTINEERKTAGQPRFDNPMADEVLLITPTGLVSLGLAEEMINNGQQPVGIGSRANPTNDATQGPAK